MKKDSIIFMFALTVLVPVFLNAQNYSLRSPDGQIQVAVSVQDRITYSVQFKGIPLVNPSPLSMSLTNGEVWGIKGKVTKKEERNVKETITPPVHQKSSKVENQFQELKLTFAGGYALTFRAFNDGIAYRFSTQRAGELTVERETFRLELPANDLLYFPEEQSFHSHNERLYLPFYVKDIADGRLASLPLLIASQNGPRMVVMESNLVDYPGLWIQGTGQQALRGAFPQYPAVEEPQSDRDVKVTVREPFIAKIKGPRDLPWRILAIANTDADLITNQLVFLLAEPSRLSDPSWIKPGKVAWDWYNANNLFGVDFKTGINMPTYKYYIDFAASHNIEYIILDEGWTKPEDVLSVSPQLDMPELIRYAASKNVGIIVWVLWNSLDRQLDKALDQYAAWGVKGIKVDFMQRDDQQMVNYYWRVAEAAAKRKLLVDYHGAHKPAGLMRTYPNVLTSEGVYGMEQTKWDKTRMIGPEHNVTLPFIRMIPGPMDFTPGAMVNATYENYFPVFTQPMSLGTRCHQLAMYVVFESPLQMLCDSPSQYLREQECLGFLSKVPAVWEKTVPLFGKVGDYVAVARQTADGNWFVGAMTDWTGRELEIPLTFLEQGGFTAEIFQDGVNADRYASDYKKVVRQVNSKETLKIQLAPGGGWAAWIHR
jgi:alpha-glucosidase